MSSETGISPTKSELGISVEDLYRLSVKQYHALADAGIVHEDDPVELLEGWMVWKYGDFPAAMSFIDAPAEVSPTEEKLGLTLASIWRFTGEEYYSMIDTGIVAEDDPVELLAGWLVRKTTEGPAHRTALDLLGDALAGRLSATWDIRAHAPITVSEGEPEPDLALVRGDRRECRQRHSGPGDIVLLVEVADTSLARDRGIKKQMYAWDGIPVYWIVNLLERHLEVYTAPASAPGGADYRERHDYGLEDEVPIVLDGVEVGRLPVPELLP
jgi:Uma2 family endonuclease